MTEDAGILFFMGNEKEAGEIGNILEKSGYDFTQSYAYSLSDFSRLLAKRSWGLIVVDCCIADVSPDQVLSRIREAGSLAPVIAIIENTDIQRALKLTKTGYCNYVIKGEYDKLLRMVQYKLKLNTLRCIGNYSCEDLFTILSAVSNGIIRFDGEGKTVFINDAAQALTGWSGIAAIGKPVEDILQVMDVKTGERIGCQRLYDLYTKEGQNFDSNLVLIPREGTKKYVSLRCTPLYGVDGSTAGGVITFQDITSYKRINEELKAERNNTRYHFQYAPIGMAVIDKNLRVRSVNDRFIDICDRADEDVIGSDICKGLGCIEGNDTTATKGRECDNCVIKKCIVQVRDSSIPLRDVEKTYNLFRDGQRVQRTFNCNFVPLKIKGENSVLISIQDVTKQRLVEEQLKTSRDFYLTLFEEFPVMVWRTDITGNVDYVNKKMLEFVGREQDKGLGIRWVANVHPGDIMNYVDAYNKAFDKREIFEYEYRVRRFDGEYRWLYSHACPYYDLDRKFAGYIGTSYDVTGKKEWEFEINRAMEATREAYRSKSEFLANMSHEIRTPLNGIQGMIDLTLLTDLTEEQRDNLNIAKNCSESLLAIINDILDFSKMEVGKVSIENVEFDIRDLINRIIRAHHLKADKKGIELNYQIPADMPDFVIGDPNRLRQVLDNLISNAVKFTDKGFANLIIRLAEKTEGYVKLQFSMLDTGIGISEREMKKLFRSFSQVNSSRTKQHKGTGLGLIIAKNIVEMMGGTLEVESEKGLGSEFSFMLRFGIGRGDGDLDGATRRYRPRTVTDAKILLVEDDEINRKVISRMLKEIGYKHDVVASGMEALKLLEENEYDLCLMDIQMPGLDGIQTTALIREGEKNAQKAPMPIVAITAYALRGDREKFLAMDMDGYIAKPFQISELYIQLESLLSNRGETRKKGTERGKNISGFLRDYMRSIQPTIDSMKNSIKNLEAAINRRDMDMAEKVAHEIKTLATLISAENLKIAAFRVELAARRGDDEESRRLYNALYSIVEKYATNISKLEE